MSFCIPDNWLLQPLISTLYIMAEIEGINLDAKTKYNSNCSDVQNLCNYTG